MSKKGNIAQRIIMMAASSVSGVAPDAKAACENTPAKHNTRLFNFL